jgi:hypothetical protein
MGRAANLIVATELLAWLGNGQLATGRVLYPGDLAYTNPGRENVVAKSPY